MKILIFCNNLEKIKNTEIIQCFRDIFIDSNISIYCPSELLKPHIVKLLNFHKNLDIKSYDYNLNSNIPISDILIDINPEVVIIDKNIKSSKLEINKNLNDKINHTVFFINSHIFSNLCFFNKLSKLTKFFLYDDFNEIKCVIEKNLDKIKTSIKTHIESETKTNIEYKKQLDIKHKKEMIMKHKQLVNNQIMIETKEYDKNPISLYENNLDPELINLLNNNKNNKKLEYRDISKYLIKYVREYKLPEIKLNLQNEAVLIEFRELPHIEFIIRNCILKLGNNWSHTIVCGIVNEKYIKNICSHISNNIKVIVFNHDITDVNGYNNLLLSKKFWDLFVGEKILIYQEDTCFFKCNINDFLQYDYIGAPWPKKNIVEYGPCVGNGGLSLRSKSIMIEVIEKCSLINTFVTEHNKLYMKNCGLNNCPEDVYFTINMFKYNIGNLAPGEIANYFSTELLNNESSTGGHNFWLSDPNWKCRVFSNIIPQYLIESNIIKSTFKICGIASPYGLNIGGGEINLLNFAKFFIDYKNCFIYLFVDEKIDVIKKTITYALGENYLLYFKFFSYEDDKNYKNQVDYYFLMGNSTFPSKNGIAKEKINNFYHCQFPFDMNKINDILINKIFIETYNTIILNSEFTCDTYKSILNNYSIKDVPNIEIVYPKCINKINTRKINKEKNSFVMIGRIFDYNPDANNKNFDLVLDVFKEIESKLNIDFKIYIIGQIYSQDMYKKLKDYNIKQLTIYSDASEDLKNKILEKSEYVINMVGCERDKIKDSYSYEHFGIGIIECINFGCIPITIDGGYPSYYVNNKNGYIFQNKLELCNIIKNILTNNKDYKKTFDNKYFDNLLDKFTNTSFIKKNMEFIK